MKKEFEIEDIDSNESVKSKENFKGNETNKYTNINNTGHNFDKNNMKIDETKDNKNVQMKNNYISKNCINNDKQFSNDIILYNLFITVNENSVIYGGKKFIKQKYQGKIKKQTKIYYKCENYRKDSHIRQGNIDRFCQGKIIYEISDDKYYFNNDHSVQCYELIFTKNGNIKLDSNSKKGTVRINIIPDSHFPDSHFPCSHFLLILIKLNSYLIWLFY